MQNNFQFNLHWNEPNPCTHQTSRPADSAVGSLRKQAANADGSLTHKPAAVLAKYFDAFRYPKI